MATRKKIKDVSFDRPDFKGRIWIDVFGYEDCYMVSIDGRIKSKDLVENIKNRHGSITTRKKKGILRKLKPHRKGYVLVSLKKNRVEKTHHVARLMLQSAYQDELKGLDVNHIDGNKANNNLSNLEVCTRSENLKHSWNVLGNRLQPLVNNWTKFEERNSNTKNVILSRPTLTAKQLAPIAGVSCHNIYKMKQAIKHENAKAD